MAALAKLYANRFNHASILSAPTLDHTVMWQAIDAVGDDAEAVRDKIYTLSEGSPVVLAYVSSQAEHQVCLVHSPREYRCPVGEAPDVMDRHAVALMGNSPGSITPVLLPLEAFERSANIRIMRDIAVHKNNYDARLAAGETYVAAITGTPAGSHARRVHRCVVLPCTMAAQAVSLPSSYLSFERFYDLFVQPHLADASHDPIREWWIHATTEENPGDGSALTVDHTVVDVTLPLQQKLQVWSHRWVTTDLSGLARSRPF